MEILALVLFILFLLIAAVGVILPALPGVPIAFLGALLAGWMTGFEELGFTPLLITASLAILGWVVDFVASWLGAKYYGAGRPGLWGGVIGSLLGLFLFPPLGFIVGALVGAVGFELLAGRPFNEALRAGIGAFLGTLGGAVAKFLILVAIAWVVLPRLW